MVKKPRRKSEQAASRKKMKYRLIKIMMEAMEEEGLISGPEKETFLKKLVSKIKPIIGQLD